jgi:Na+-driven multidrug efflux pump
MFVSVSVQWLLLLPLAFLMGPTLGFGLLGIWLMQGGTRSLQSFLFLTLWRRKKWQNIVV